MISELTYEEHKQTVRARDQPQGELNIIKFKDNSLLAILIMEGEVSEDNYEPMSDREILQTIATIEKQTGLIATVIEAEENIS